MYWEKKMNVDSPRREKIPFHKFAIRLVHIAAQWAQIGISDEQKHIMIVLSLISTRYRWGAHACAYTCYWTHFKLPVFLNLVSDNYAILLQLIKNIIRRNIEIFSIETPNV